jgi:hypothetical protein
LRFTRVGPGSPRLALIWPPAAAGALTAALIFIPDGGAGAENASFLSQATEPAPPSTVDPTARPVVSRPAPSAPPTLGPAAPTNEGAVEPGITLPRPPPEADAPFILPLLTWDAVTDRFGAPRGEDLVHGGIDLALDSYPSSPVLASCAGTVAAAATNNSYGNYVVVDCGEGWTTLYGHLSAALVEPGALVNAGTVLGASGNTGFSTGEHLHFEIRYLGVPLDPEDYLDFNVPEGAPLSSGPLVFATPTPPQTPESSPSPEETGTPPPAPTPEPDPERPNTWYLERSGEHATAPNTLLVEAHANGTAPSVFLLALNRLAAGATAPALEVAASASCSNCVAVAAVVQVNLYETPVAAADAAPVAPVAKAVIESCGEGCEAVAYALRIDITMAAGDEETAERVAALLARLREELKSLAERPASIAVAALDERLSAVLAELGAETDTVTVASHELPGAAVETPTPEPSPSPAEETATPEETAETSPSPEPTATPETTPSPAPTETATETALPSATGDASPTPGPE